MDTVGGNLNFSHVRLSILAVRKSVEVNTICMRFKNDIFESNLNAQSVDTVGGNSKWCFKSRSTKKIGSQGNGE